MALKATDVFVPGAYPQYTYVERAAKGFEANLRDSLSTPGQVVSLSGPSKSGKTVLVERVVGRDLLLPISGSSIKKPEEVWQRALDWMDLPSSTTATTKITGTASVEVTGKGSVGLPLVAKGEAAISGAGELAREISSETTKERRGLQQVVTEIGGSDFVILLDDFHYMDRDVQIDVAKSLKEAVRLGVKIVTASVSHRGDDVVRANPELRGRVRSIDLGYWSEPELRKIADAGFAALGAAPAAEAIDAFTRESAGSPQLMQSLCLHACFVLGLREQLRAPEQIVVTPSMLLSVFEQTSAGTDFRSLVDVLDAGPRTRGTERKTYKFHDGSEGDVYRVVLKAVAEDPPQLSFPYEELLKRTVQVCSGDAPVGSSVTGTCLHMTKLALEKFPRERAIDWDEQKQVFDIPDPYLLFYLRWSNRLRER